MKPRALLSSVAGLSIAILVGASGKFDPALYAEEDVITRDVIVVGGGASGTYTSITLGDMGKSVVLVDRAGQLGGHVNTYTDSTTGKAIDYGTLAYLNNTITTNFFARLNIPIVTYNFTPSTSPVYADFTSGTLLSNFTPQNEFGAAYIAQLDKYPYLNNGFHLPDPVPEDLLLTWGEYIEKYNLQSSAFLVSTELEGSGEPLDILALYVFNSINSYLASEIEGAAVTTAAHDNSALYQKALEELGTNALLNSTVIAGERSTNSSSVKLLISTPTGPKLLIASQLVLGIPPILSNMSPFSLDQHEHRLLSQITGTPYYCGLVSNTGLSTAHRYINAGTNTQYHQPKFPGAFRLYPTAVEGIFLYWYGSLTSQTQPEIEANVAASIKDLQRTTVNATQGTTPDFLAFANHSPYHPSVPAEAVRNGFYNDMYALQGYRNTWYVGGLFVFSSGQLWNSTATLLPQIVAAAS